MPSRDLLDDWDTSDGGSVVSRGGTSNLADILERVLDKGVVVAGDIVVSLVDVELLTIRLRLLIASVDKAKEMGIDWWEHDPWLSAGARGDGKDGAGGGGELAERLERLEQAVDRLAGALGTGDGDGRRKAAPRRRAGERTG